jgi:curved DNA-binding protein CbpA
MHNCYRVLGTSPEANDSQLKSAFHKLAKAFHPDLHAGDKQAEERFKEINQAYQVLRNPGARTAYDVFLADKRSAARRRTWKAAATMSTTFVLSVALCFSLMIWLQGGWFSLAPDQETARPSENVTIAPRPRLVSGTGASGQDSGEARMAGAFPAERDGVVQTSGDQASPVYLQTASNRNVQARWIMYQRSRAKMASVVHVTNANDETEGTAVRSPPTRAELAQAERMLDKGQQFLARGNIVIAREYFVRAAELGLAIAALRQGETHDPEELGGSEVHGLKQDPAEAKKWYARAVELGVPEAETRLRRVGGR